MKTSLQHIKRQSQASLGSVLLIGAGNGGDLLALRELGLRQTVLVEAHPGLAEELTQRIQPDAGETVWQYAITPEAAARVTLNVMSDVCYSSVSAPARLLQYLPNLRITTQLEVPAQSISDALDTLTLNAEEINILILDVPGQALGLLHAATPKKIQQFNWIVVSASVEALYENEATEPEVMAYLAQTGFDKPLKNPDALCLYNRLLLRRNDELVYMHQLRASLAESQAERDELAAKLATTSQNLQSTQKSLSALGKELEAAKRLASQNAASTSLIVQTIEAQYSALIQESQNQQDSLDAAKTYLEATIKKEILNATKQLEAFISVQHRLGMFGAIPEMHGWPISPDFALYLIELVERKKYDLIIEFGSGASTLLIAKTVAKIAGKRHGEKRIQQVAFEHLQKYHEQTQRDLKEAGLQDKVQLVLAPIAPYAAKNGNTYPYYNCNQTLLDLAKPHDPKSLKILVLVDGPPAATGRHARYPAVPAVLSHFTGAQIDILLDDYIRTDEKEIAKMWISDIERAGLTYSVLEKKMEKDACLISIIHP